MRILKVRDEQGQEFEVDADKISEAEQDGFLPVVRNAKGEEHRVSFQDLPTAKQDGFDLVGATPLPRVVDSESPVSKLEAAIRGGAQGIALEFADEAEARARAALGQGEYEDILPQVRDRFKQAAQEQPVTYYGSDVAGSFLVPVPGLGLASKAIKGTNLAAKAGRAAAAGATGGALVGAGSSEAEDVSGIATDAAKGAAMGAAIAPALESVGKLAVKGAVKVADSPLLGRQIRRAYKIAKETKQQFNEGVQALQDKLLKKEISPLEVEQEVAKLAKPFGFRERYNTDIKQERNQLTDIIEEMTSPTGAGPLGAVNRKYDTARVLAEAEEFVIPVDTLNAAIRENVTDPKAQDIMYSALKKQLGVKSSQETFEETSKRLREKTLAKVDKSYNKAKDKLSKESIKEANDVLKKAGQNADEIYQNQLSAKFEVDKRRFLNREANKLSAQNKDLAPDEQINVSEEIAKLEDELNANFQIFKSRDQATGQAVYEYSTRIGDEATGFTLANSVPTKTNFDQFAKLSPEEKAKAAIELSNQLYKDKLAALNEVRNSIELIVKPLGNNKFMMEAAPASRAETMIPTVRIEDAITPTQALKRTDIKFDDIQQIRSNLNQAYKMAKGSGDYALLNEIDSIRQTLSKVQGDKLSPESFAALQRANELRKTLPQSDVRLLLNKGLDPLENISDNAEKALAKDDLRNVLQKDLRDISSTASTPRKADIDAAKQAFTQMEDPSGKALVSKIEEAEKTAERAALGKEMFDSKGLTINNAGMSLRGGFIAVGAATGRVAGSKFGQSMKMLTLPPESILKLADKAQSPTVKRYLTTMATTDAAKRKALLYVMLQNAGTKKELDELLNDEEN